MPLTSGSQCDSMTLATCNTISQNEGRWFSSSFQHSRIKAYLKNGSMYSRMEQVKFFKACLPQILQGPFLNILSQII